MKIIRHCVFIFIACLFCKCNSSDREIIVFHKDVREVRDSLMVTVKIMDALLQKNNISSYLWDEDDSIYVAHKHFDFYWMLLDDTLQIMKNVPYSVRERFLRLILFLRKNNIDQCGWSNVVGAWGFDYKPIRISSDEDNRWIYINTSEAIRKNILLEDNILDEREGLILSQPDNKKFREHRGPIPWDKYR